MEAHVSPGPLGSRSATRDPSRARAPGPKGVPLLGNLPEMGADILGFFSRCAQEYGDIVGIRLAGWPAVLLSHPDFVEYVLVKNHENFVKHSFFWRHVRAIFGKGLLTSEGDAWLRQRRLAAPAFAGTRLNGYAETMVAYTERMLQRWHPSQVFDVHREAMGLTLQIAAKTLFDAETEQDVTEIGEVFDDTLEEIVRRFRRPFRIPDAIPTPGNLRYRRGVQRMDQLVARIIREGRKHPVTAATCSPP